MLTFILYIDWGIWIQKKITHRSFLSCFCSFWNNVSIIGFFSEKYFRLLNLNLVTKNFWFQLLAWWINDIVVSTKNMTCLNQSWFWFLKLWCYDFEIANLFNFTEVAHFISLIRYLSNNRYKTISNQIFSEYFHYLFCIFLDTVKLFDMLGGAKIYRS